MTRTTKATSGAAPEKVKAVGIWIRVSTEDQAKGESPEHHERRARCYAEAKGWHVAAVYHLEAVSGKSVKDHPETQRMLQDVRTGTVGGLIFSKLARLARNTRELLEFADLFREYGADLISLQEAIDTSTPAGRLFYTLIAAMAQWEREEIAERVAASVPIRAKLGKPLGGAAPFGYRWENRELVPDPKEAPVRKLIYELFLEHKRRKTVARLLNEAGYRTRNGSRWSDTTIERLIRDPTAKGLRRANYTRSLGEGRHWVFKDEKDWVLTPVEAIVEQDVWEHCNRLLDERRRNGKLPSRKAVHLFTGFAYCVCGRKMYVPSNAPKYICYGCRNKIPVADLEAVFHEELRAFLLSPEEVAIYLAEADETIQAKEAQLAVLVDEQHTLSRKMDKTMQLYLADRISGEGFKREYGPMEERLHQVADQIPALQGELDFLKIQFLSSDQIVNQARDLHGQWTELGAADRRNIVETVLERIIIGKDEVTIRLSSLPAPAADVAGRQRNFRGSWPRPASATPGR